MEEEVYKLLDKLKIKYIKINHPALFTYDDIQKYNIDIDALICKSLFIRNSNKSQYYIVALPIQKRVDLMLLGAIFERFDTIVEFSAFEDFISFEKNGKNKTKRRAILGK